jgi:hypothetical protein
VARSLRADSEGRLGRDGGPDRALLAPRVATLPSTRGAMIRVGDIALGLGCVWPGERSASSG